MNQCISQSPCTLYFNYGFLRCTWSPPYATKRPFPKLCLRHDFFSISTASWHFFACCCGCEL